MPNDDSYWTCYRCGHTFGPRFLEMDPTPTLDDDLDPTEYADYLDQARTQADLASIAQRFLTGAPVSDDELDQMRDHLHQLHTATERACALTKQIDERNNE